MKVKILKDAFAIMIAKAIEEYKRETLGLLMGQKNNGNVVVTNAIASHTLEQTFTSVNVVPHRFSRLENTIRHLGGQIVGDYHAHTEFGGNEPCATPSKTDLDDMCNSNLPIYIILAIKDKKTNAQWHYCSDGRLAGSFGEYWLNIAAYYWDRQANQHRKATIVCPYAIRRKSHHSFLINSADTNKSSEIAAT